MRTTVIDNYTDEIKNTVYMTANQHSSKVIDFPDITDRTTGRSFSLTAKLICVPKSLTTRQGNSNPDTERK